MPSTYSPNLRIELPSSGEQGNTWGNTTNNNIGTLLETAISGYVSLIAMTDANYTLIALNGANDQARQMFLDVPSSVTLTATRNITAPSVPKIYVVRNMSTGGQSVVVKTSGGTGITVPNGVTKTIACDGTNFSDATNGVNLLYLNTAVTGASASNQATTKLYVDTQDTALLPRDGTRAMTGELILSSAGTPSNANAAVSKTYADTKLSKAGGTMTGTLTLASAVPTGTWDAVPLGYVDGISIAGGNNGISVTGSVAAGFDVFLEPPTGGQIGGVKQGSNITIAADGTISAAAAASGIATIQVNSLNGLAGSSINVGSTAYLTLNAGAGLTTLVKGSGGTFVNASATDVVNLISTNYVQNASYATNAGTANNPSGGGSFITSSNIGSQTVAIAGTCTGNATTASNPSGGGSFITSSNIGSQTVASAGTCTGNAATASSPSGGGSFITSSNIGGQSVNYASSAGSATTATQLSGGYTASSFVLKTGSTMTGALNVQNSSSPAKYIAIETVYDTQSFNYYPAIYSKNTSGSDVATLVLAQTSTLGTYQVPVIFSAGTLSGNPTTNNPPVGTYGSGSHSQFNYDMAVYGNIYGYYNTNTGSGGNITIPGTISAGAKPFRIPHPVVADKDLVHIAVESPRADMLYRGVVKLTDGYATVEIDANSNMTDGTFAAFTQNVEVVALRNKDGFTRVKASEVVQGTFHITAEDATCTDNIAWMVVAERADPFMKELNLTDINGQLIPEQDKLPVREQLIISGTDQSAGA